MQACCLAHSAKEKQSDHRRNHDDQNHVRVLLPSVNPTHPATSMSSMIALRTEAAVVPHALLFFARIVFWIYIMKLKRRFAVHLHHGFSARHHVVMHARIKIREASCVK